MDILNYSPKERIRLTRSLSNPEAGAIDLQLLSKLQPSHSQLSVWSLNPKRYADDILFSLLEVAPAEEIRLNRRACSAANEPKPETDKVPEDSAQGQADGAANPPAEDSKAESPQEGEAIQETKAEELHEAKTVADLKEAQQRADEAEQRAEEAEQRADEAEQRADEAEERADEAEERADEAEQRADEAEERADEAETALEEAKKKDTSKKKTNTQI